MECKIPDNEVDNILSVFWQMLGAIEGRTEPKQDPLDAILVEGAYNVLNRIGYTKTRPRWEEKIKADNVRVAMEYFDTFIANLKEGKK